MGRRLLENESRNFPKGLKRIPSEDLQKLASDYGLSRAEDLYAAVGFGKYSARQVLARYFGEPSKETEKQAEDAGKPTLVKTVKRMLGMGEAPLIVKGQDDLLVFRAKCCNAIPGDEIVGYVTRGRGVAVHTRGCPNVQNLMYQTERRIAVEWGTGTATFPVDLVIRAKDRAGLLAEITAVISDAGSNIRSLESRPDRQNARIEASLEILDKRQLESIISSIRRINGIFGVDRINQP
jgi:guanosine-3',5'-bis(diphosphate) 3'-pyrophosphohydrolase